MNIGHLPHSLKITALNLSANQGYAEAESVRKNVWQTEDGEVRLGGRNGGVQTVSLAEQEVRVFELDFTTTSEKEEITQ